MALVLSSGRSDAAVVSFNPVHFVGQWFAKARQGRAQRQALNGLLALEPHQLDDLGINRGDLVDALRAGRATGLLADRRAARLGA